jgi:hypothetical protein
MKLHYFVFRIGACSELWIGACVWQRTTIISTNFLLLIHTNLSLILDIPNLIRDSISDIRNSIENNHYCYSLEQVVSISLCSREDSKPISHPCPPIEKTLSANKIKKRNIIEMRDGEICVFEFSLFSLPFFVSIIHMSISFHRPKLRWWWKWCR